jgi:hypothetical protein
VDQSRTTAYRSQDRTDTLMPGLPPIKSGARVSAAPTRTMRGHESCRRPERGSAGARFADASAILSWSRVHDRRFAKCVFLSPVSSGDAHIPSFFVCSRHGMVAFC